MATRLDQFARPRGIGVPYTGPQPMDPFGPPPLDNGGRGITAVAPQFPGMPYNPNTGVVPPHMRTGGVSQPVPLPPGMPYGNPYGPISAPVPLPPGMPYGTPGTGISAPVNLPPGMPYGTPQGGPVSAPVGLPPGMPYGTPQGGGISQSVPLPPGMTVGNPKGTLPGLPTSDALANTRGIPGLAPGTGLATPKTPGTWTPGGVTGGQPPMPVDPTGPVSPNDSAPGGSGSPGKALIDPATGQPVTPANSAPNFGPGQTVQDMLDFFINGEYADNARRRGAEQANARGLMNSSLAAGASERAALEAVQPFVSEGMGLLGAREGRAFQGQENQLDRIQNVNNMILGSNIQERQMAIQQAYEQGNMGLAAQLQRDQARDDYTFRRALQNDATMQQDWLSSNAFSREFNAGLAMMPVNSAMDMFGQLMQAGINDPEVFTPEYMSGMSNFFNNYMQAILAQYFPNGPTSAPPPAAPVQSPEILRGA